MLVVNLQNTNVKDLRCYAWSPAVECDHNIYLKIYCITASDFSQFSLKMQFKS